MKLTKEQSKKIEKDLKEINDRLDNIEKLIDKRNANKSKINWAHVYLWRGL